MEQKGQEEAAGGASPETIAVNMGGAGSADPLRQPSGETTEVKDNTCCGLHLSAPHTVGPFLKYWGLQREEEGGTLRFFWTGSLLVVTKAPAGEVAAEVQLPSGRVESLLPEELDRHRGWTALRFKMRLQQADTQIQVSYRVTVSGQELRTRNGDPYSFFIVGRDQAPHWGFYSCSGFTSDVPAKKRDQEYGGLAPLWRDVLMVHKKEPLHLLVGGGDQLYCDDVWTLPALETFLKQPNDTPKLKEDKRKSPYDDAMRDQVDDYYFHHYCCHFGSKVIEEVYGVVPQVMTWDDHDIFDGWGSYPHHLQQSEVFQGVFNSANRWYSIFQQHCTPNDKQPVVIYELGGRTAIVACDQRHRRLRDQILPLEHYMELTELCNRLPKGIKHVVFVSTVPIVYPDIKGARAILRMLKMRFFRWLTKRLGMELMNAFGEPELMDDLDDHWCSPDHHDERRFLIEHLQMLSKYRGCRVTLLSGDVHVCGAGYLVSHPEPEEAQRIHDFRYMPQIISSAIANPPPPLGLMRILNFFSIGALVNKSTKHAMDRVIRTHLGVDKALENKRNWCEVIEDEASLSMTYRLRVEDDPGSTEPPQTYDVVVPPLRPLDDTLDEYYSVYKAHKVGCLCC